MTPQATEWEIVKPCPNRCAISAPLPLHALRAKPKLPTRNRLPSVRQRSHATSMDIYTHTRPVPSQVYDALTSLIVLLRSLSANGVDGAVTTSSSSVWDFASSSLKKQPGCQRLPALGEKVVLLSRFLAVVRPLASRHSFKADEAKAPDTRKLDGHGSVDVVRREEQQACGESGGESIIDSKREWSCVRVYIHSVTALSGRAAPVSRFLLCA